MNINIICIGKLKEKYWVDACDEYMKRLRAYTGIKIIELKEAKLPKNASLKDESNVLKKEGRSILGKISEDDFVITMEIEGKMLDSPEFSQKIISIFEDRKSTIDFIIGGSNGLSDAVKMRSDFAISFSKMTFPHQMARVVLLEQIYRAYKIANGETYHK